MDSAMRDADGWWSMVVGCGNGTMIDRDMMGINSTDDQGMLWPWREEQERKRKEKKRKRKDRYILHVQGYGSRCDTIRCDVIARLMENQTKSNQNASFHLRFFLDVEMIEICGDSEQPSTFAFCRCTTFLYLVVTEYWVFDLLWVFGEQS